MKLSYDAAGKLVGIGMQHASQMADIKPLIVEAMPVRHLLAA